MKKKNKDSNKVFDASVMLLSQKSSFTMQEAYKTFRTNVIFSLPGSGCKCIAIVSANRGEGKSSIASNLSIAMAQLNKKVLLIDCDMRLPTIASKLGVSSSPGLSNYLSGECESLPIVHDDSRGMDVIPSGNIPPDSTALINSEEMKNLIRILKTMYDYVIFDFPPINVVTDAMIMSDMIDGYLVVIRHSVSEKKMVADTLRQMQFADAKIIGFVYNGKDEEKKYYKKRGRYGYYSKYYYKSSNG